MQVCEPQKLAMYEGAFIRVIRPARNDSYIFLEPHPVHYTIKLNITCTAALGLETQEAHDSTKVGTNFIIFQ